MIIFLRGRPTRPTDPTTARLPLAGIGRREISLISDVSQLSVRRCPVFTLTDVLLRALTAAPPLHAAAAAAAAAEDLHLSVMITQTVGRHRHRLACACAARERWLVARCVGWSPVEISGVQERTDVVSTHETERDGADRHRQLYRRRSLVSQRPLTRRVGACPCAVSMSETSALAAWVRGGDEAASPPALTAVRSHHH